MALTIDTSIVRAFRRHRLPPRRSARDATGFLSGPLVSDWDDFHRIRKSVLFDARGRGDAYVRDHPDDRRPGHEPLLFHVRGLGPVGVLRIDLIDGVSAALRLVAVEPGHQRQGHGRRMIKAACRRIEDAGRSVVAAAPDAAAFYRRLGFIGADRRSDGATSKADRLWRRIGAG